MTTKQELRQTIRRQRAAHTAAESSAVIARLKCNDRFRQAKTLLLYSALPDEVPTLQLMDELVAEGRSVLLPRVVSATAMELRRYSGTGDLVRGAFGIMEPAGEVFTDFGSIDVAVVPALAFDRAGYRLGRGRGYYDRFLSRVPFIYKIGLCYPAQLLDSIPSDAHDVPMDCVVC